MQAPVEPGFGELQVAVSRGTRDAQKLGCLFVGATEEVAQLDDTNGVEGLFFFHERCQSLSTVDDSSFL
jgi:hypothetical protein